MFLHSKPQLASSSIDKPDFFGEERVINNDAGFEPTVDSLSKTSVGKGNSLSGEGFVTCRDSFHNGPLTKVILFACGNKPKGMDVNVAAFINEFEKKMGHENLSRFGPTNQSKVMWIEPAQFWHKNPLRSSLFTALLRAGRKYDIETKNFEEALYSRPYTNSTKLAVERFLQGKTWYTGPRIGWVDGCSRKSEKDLESVLTLRPVTPEQLMNFALEKLNLTKGKLEEEYRKRRTEIKRQSKDKKENSKSPSVLESKENRDKLKPVDVS